MKKHSDAYLKDWDEFINNPTMMFAHFFQQEKQFYLSVVKGGQSVLDIGTGTGRIAEYIAPQTRPAKVLAVDKNQSIIEPFRERLLSQNIVPYVLDARHLPWNDKTIDVAVFGCNGFGNIPIKESKGIIKEISRLLVPDGLFLGTLYSEDAAEHQVTQYVHTGWLDIHVGRHAVYADTIGLVSRRYTRKEITDLLGKDFDVGIKKLCPMAYGFIARKR